MVSTSRQVTGPGAPPVVVGRLAEQRALDEVLGALGEGRGRLVVVEGEAGIGKTTLLRTATATAAGAPRISTWSWAADEIVRRPGSLALALAAAAPHLRGARRIMAALGCDGGVPQPDEHGFAVIEACVDLVEEAAGSGPLLLVLDDLHGADGLSLRVAIALARRAPALALGVLASCRLAPREALVHQLVELATTPPGSLVELGPLRAHDVDELVGALTGAAVGPVLREQLAAAAGNPLFVNELVGAWADGAQLRFDAGVVELVSDQLPADLRASLLRRLAWLDTDGVEALRVASALGTTFSLSELAAVLHRPVAAVARVLHDATRAAIVSGDGDRLRFRHDLVRRAVYEDIPPAVRRDLHRAAATGLAHAGAPATAVAWHHTLGAVHGDLDAVAGLERAADEVLGVDPREAVILLETAATLVPPRSLLRSRLQVKLIEPLTGIGRLDEAHELADQVLAGTADPSVEFLALQGLAAIHGNRGDLSAAIDALGRAAGAPGAPAGLARRLRCLSAQLSLMHGTGGAAERAALDEARRTAECDGDEALACLAHQALGMAELLAGRADTALGHLRAAVARHRGGRVPWASYLTPDLLAAACLAEQDRLDEAVHTATAARRDAEQGGVLAVLPMAHATLAAVHYYAGRWDDAIAECETALGISDETGSHNFVLYSEAILALIALRRGDGRGARRHVSRGRDRLDAGAPGFGADWLLAAHADLLAREGDERGALALAEDTWAATAPVRFMFGHRHLATTLIDLAGTAGRDDLTHEVATAVEHAARGNPAAGARALARRCRALVDRDPEAAWESVVLARTSPLRPDHAVTCEVAATVLAAAGRREDALALLDEAAAVLAALGADGDAARVHDRATRLGATRRPRRSRPTLGWGALTPTERKVCDLVAEGLTNPQIGQALFISRRTVETHLTHAFHKLGVTNRAQVAAAVARRSSADRADGAGAPTPGQDPGNDRLA